MFILTATTMIIMGSCRDFNKMLILHIIQVEGHVPKFCSIYNQALVWSTSGRPLAISLVFLGYYCAGIMPKVQVYTWTDLLWGEGKCRIVFHGIVTDLLTLIDAW